MRFETSTLCLVLLVACATGGTRSDPDLQTIQQALEAAAAGEAELAATLAETAAATCSPEGSCRLTTHLLLARQFSQLGQPALGLEHARIASKEADREGDAITRYTVHILHSTIASEAEETEEAEAALASAVPLLASVPEDARAEEPAAFEVFEALADGAQARIHALHGNAGEAVVSQTVLVETMRGMDRPHRNLAAELVRLAVFQLDADDPGAGIASLEEAIALAEASGDVQVESLAVTLLDEIARPD